MVQATEEFHLFKHQWTTKTERCQNFTEKMHGDIFYTCNMALTVTVQNDERVHYMIPLECVAVQSNAH